MGTIVGIFALGLMVIVLVIAVGSLIIVGTIPIGKLLERWNRSNRDD